MVMAIYLSLLPKLKQMWRNNAHNLLFSHNKIKTIGILTIYLSFNWHKQLNSIKCPYNECMTDAMNDHWVFQYRLFRTCLFIHLSAITFTSNNFQMFCYFARQWPGTTFSHSSQYWGIVCLYKNYIFTQFAQNNNVH